MTPGFGARGGQCWGRTVRVGGTGALAPPIHLRPDGEGAGGLPWVELCTWQEHEHERPPQPVVLMVETSHVAPVEDIPAQDPVRVSPLGWQGSPRQGALYVEYGSHGALSRRYIDPREGSYQLPPCHYVSVGGRFYATNPEAVPPWSLGVSLSPGEVTHPAQPTYSGLVLKESELAGSQLFRVPPGAYALRFGMANSTVASANTMEVYGTQPELQIGPWPDYVPAVADVVPFVPAASVLWDGLDAATLLAEALLRW